MFHALTKMVKDITTLDGPKALGQDTIEYRWTIPMTGTCSATGGQTTEIAAPANSIVTHVNCSVLMTLSNTGKIGSWSIVNASDDPVDNV